LSLTILVLGLLGVGSAARFGATPRPHPAVARTPTSPAGALYQSPDTAVPRQRAMGAVRAPEAALSALVDRVDGPRWHADVVALAQFGAADGVTWGTRRSLSGGNLAARDWIANQLESLGWDTYLDDFFMVGGTSFNVVAERRGATRPDDIYIVGAHMDSVSPDPFNPAPGAEDNASGTAGLLEIARALDGYTPAATIRVIAFSGEEQGLVGSQEYVEYLADVSGELDQVKAMYNLDMVGYTSHTTNLHVLLQSYDPEQYPWMGNLRDHLAAMAATYTSLNVYTSNYSLGSDHLPFLWRGIPAVLMIAAEHASYPYYHTTDDLPEYVVPAEGEAIIRTVLASVAAKSGVICIYADVNCDGSVDWRDLVAMAPAWALGASDPDYDAAFDLDADARISAIDFQLAALALFPD
jgi:hypothetical protein